MNSVFRYAGILAVTAASLALSAPSGAGSRGADQWVEAARQAAQQDRHDEALAEFQNAISLEPSRRMEWLRELADQFTFAGRPEAAIPLYQEFLAARGVAPEETRRARLGLALALSWNNQNEAALSEYEGVLSEHPDDIEAQLGRARVLSWLDRHGPAKMAYEDVLRQDSGNGDARRSLGRVQSWRGRQRDAQRRLIDYLRDHPDDPEAIFLLAQAQNWMGRSDLAQQTLAPHLAVFPGDRRARELFDEIEFQRRPVARLTQQESHQSDGLRISVSSFEQNFHLNEGLTTIGPRFQFYRYDPDGDPIDEIQVARPGLYTRHRFSDFFEVTGDFFVDLIDTQGGGGGDHTTFTYNTYATIWPSDLLRIDIGSSRTTFDNVKSLSRDITAVYGSASIDVLPNEKTRFTARTNWGDYSDGNERTWWQAEVERRVFNHPQILVGYRYTGFDFTRELDNGYFNPGSYHSNEGTFSWAGQLGERLTYRVDGSAGAEHPSPGSTQFIWSGGGNFAYRLAERIEAEVGYYYFSSDNASSGGFSRGTGTAGLRFVW